jgi:cobalt-zinc-cadmium efflux system protein
VPRCSRALGSALLLVGVAVWVLIQAVDPLRSPVEIDSRLMLVVAFIRVLANVAGLLVLRPAQAKSLNMGGAYLEVLGDVIGSLAFVAAAVLILIAGWTPFDAIASLLIVVIIPGAGSLLREVVDVLLEATPHGVDLAEVREQIKRVRGVVDVHDLHTWTIPSGVPVLSAHVIVDTPALARAVPVKCWTGWAGAWGGHFDVSHCTFQLEPVGHQEHEAAHHA